MAIIAKIGADSSDFDAKMRGVTQKLDEVGESVRTMFEAFAAYEIIKQAGEALHEYVAQGFEAIDANAKLARQLGTTYDSLRAAQVATDMAGISNEQFALAAQKVNTTLGEARTGSADAGKAFQQLGLDVQTLSKAGVNERFAAIADRVRELGLSTQQTSVITRELGIKGGELVDMLRQGGDAFRDAAKDVADFGLGLSAIDTQKVEEAQDALSRVRLSLEGARNQVVVALAPVITALAEKFTDAAKAAGGWGTVATEAVQKVVNGIAFTADVLRGLEVAWASVKLVGTAAFAAIASAVEVVFTTMEAGNSVVITLINSIIGVLQQLGAEIPKLPKLSDSDFARSIHQFGDDIRNTVTESRDELAALAEQPMPSDNIKKFYEDVVKAANARAALNNKGQNTNNEGNADFTDPEEDKKQQAEYQRKQAAIQARLDQVRKAVQSEKQIEDDAFKQKLADLDAAENAGLSRGKEALQLRQQVLEDHLRKMNAIEQKSLTDQQRFEMMTWKQKTSFIATELDQITSSVASKNELLFRINQAAALANAGINISEGISKCLSLGPYGIALAAVVGAAGAVQIASILSAKYSGTSGSAGSNSGASVAALPQQAAQATQQQAPQQNQLLVVQGLDAGSLFSGKQIRELASKLADFSRDGGKVQFS